MYGRFGGSKNGTADLTVDVAHDTWNKVVLSWSTKFEKHPARVYFYRSTGTLTPPLSAAEVARISSGIGVRLTVGKGWDWGNLRIQLDAHALWCSVIPQPTGQPVDPKWQRKLEANPTCSYTVSSG